MAKDSKVKKLDALICKASQYKENIVYKSTGMLPLDVALKCGGYVSGRICEAFGPNHSGKTLMAMLAIIWDQKMYGRSSLFTDTEGSFDVTWFVKLGGNPELLDIYDPYNQKDVHGEEVYDNVIDLIETGKYGFAVVDSMMGPALLSKEVLTKGLDDTQRMGVQAKLHKGFLMRAFIKTKQTDTNLIMTNHIADKIGVMFGEKETTPGGSYMKFAAEQRLRIGTPQDKKEDIGHTVQGIIKKNKRGASAGKKFNFYLSYQTGIDNFEEMGRLLVNEELINKKERPDLVIAMRADLKLYEDYRVKLLDAVNNGLPPTVNPDEPVDVEEMKEDDFDFTED